MSNMVSSQKDVDKEQANNNSSKSARLHTTDDYILSEFLDFPQFSPDAHFDSLYSLRTESDCWENSNQLSKATECKSSINKMDNVCIGSLMKFCSTDPHSEVNAIRDSDVSLHEMSLSDNLNAWAFNTGTFDAFDYIEESGSSVNMDNRFESVFQSAQYNSSSQCFGYIGGHAEDIDDGTAGQGDSELGSCHAEQLPYINCCSWPAENIQMDLTSQNHRFETVADQQASTHAENGFIWSDWSLITSECEKNICKEQCYGSAELSANTVMCVPSADVDACTGSENSEYIAPLENSSTSLIEVLDYKITNSTQTNINELQPDTGSVDNTQLVQKYAQLVHQREDTESALRNITEMSLVSMTRQIELPCSAHMTVDRQSASSLSDELKDTMSAPSRMNTTIEHECPALVEQFPSESSHVSHTQAKRENNIHTIASPNKTYLKVGKRGRYVTLPAKRVNELMVRDLLCISGNKEEMSIRVVTQDYRNNIRRILEQKVKRLNHLKFS
ncbi:hypothetical protein BsWGS_15082 [Bradybaena similaris]